MDGTIVRFVVKVLVSVTVLQILTTSLLFWKSCPWAGNSGGHAYA